MKVTVLIGMEAHLQLRTKSKMFCRCPVRFGAPPNELVCPVCLGMPGALPVPNREAMVMALSLAQALRCEPAEWTTFERKNYFYADLPKGYQISQYTRPLATCGRLEIVSEDAARDVRVRRLHIEEDTGKSLHAADADVTRVDFNRAGTPLVEVVSEPDLRSPAEARAYLNELRALVRYLDVSDGSMEEGNLRCEPNVNLAIEDGGKTVRTPVVEIKNLNSVRHVERALEAEIRRQLALYEARGAAAADEPRCTCGYDEERNETFVMRPKEAAHDYRYFPEPDIPPVELGAAWLEEAAARVPELPADRRRRFGEQFELGPLDAERLCRDRRTADYFERVVEEGAPAKPAANWIGGEVARHANRLQRTVVELELPPASLAGLIRAVEEGAVARQAAVAEVLPRLIEDREPLEHLLAGGGLAPLEDANQLREAARRAVAGHPRAAEDVRAGKEKALGALMGAVMEETGGKANPRVVRDVLIEILENP